MTCHHPLPHGPANTALVHEGEAIERSALRSLHDAATPDLRRDLGLAWHEAPGVTASVAAALPQTAIVVNRAFLGDGAAQRAAAAPYHAAGVGRFFIHLPCGTAPRPDAPTKAGLREARAWQKFLRPGGTPLPVAPVLDVARLEPGPDAVAAARIVCAAFDLGRAAEPWLARICHDARWHVFLVRIDGVPAGTGALFVSGRTGWCDWGATAPAFRGRGVQLALLRHRLALADRLRLDRVHTGTGAPAPGDPQHSYRNILRCGFAETILRRNLTPDLG